MPAPPDYKSVVERIADFKEKHPEGCLRPADPAIPYRIETIGDKTFVVVVAAAFRSPDDPSPGIGIAWEPFPGPTNFTRDSELQNAETSAWGRAIVAVLASESKSVASQDDLNNRGSGEAAPVRRGGPPPCVVCGEPMVGKAIPNGSGVAHEACVKPADDPNEEPF
jgi:hypothetical protein